MSQEIIGQSDASRQMRAFILKAARLDFPVLLCGETGVGKEIVARRIHQLSRRRDAPFIPVNCAGIPHHLAESELFGHRKGSFTDAKMDRIGLIELAEGGTIFLDEISEMAMDIQAKLLRALELKELRRVGDSILKKVDVRFISATNRDLECEIKKGKFRQDLYFRINVLRLNIPPLRERKEDILLFVENLLQDMGIEFGQRKRMNHSAIEKLVGYSFPGNIRELENILRRAFALTERTEISPQDIVFEKVEAEEEEEEEEEEEVKLYTEMVFGGKSFWELIHNPFLRRDLNRKQVKAILSMGLKETRGSYKRLLPLFHIGESDKDYKKFMRILTLHRLR